MVDCQLLENRVVLCSFGNKEEFRGKMTMVFKGDLVGDYCAVAQVIPMGYLTCPKAKRRTESRSGSGVMGRWPGLAERRLRERELLARSAWKV